MQRTSFAQVECPIARTLDCVGEWWSLLILRDALIGRRRFDEFGQSLGIAPNILARRLRRLTENELLERRQYQERPTRYEYLLTPRGRDIFPALAALGAWGNRHLSREGAAIRVVDRASGRVLDPIVADAASLMPITAETAMLARLPG